MSTTKLPSAFAAAVAVAPGALAQTETRLPEEGVTASLDEIQGNTPLVTPTGAMTDTRLRGLLVSVVVIANTALRAQSAAQPDDALYNTSDSSLLFNFSPFSRLGSALLVNS